MALKNWVNGETVEGADMQALVNYMPDVGLYCLMPRDLPMRGGDLTSFLTFQKILSFDIECLLGQTLGIFFQAKGDYSQMSFDTRIVTPSGRQVATMQTGSLSGSYASFGGFWDLRAYSTGNCRVDMRGARAAVEIFANDGGGSGGQFAYIRYLRLWWSQTTAMADVGEPTPGTTMSPDIPPP